MATGRVRPFVEHDIPQVADLHRRIFRVSPEGTPELDRLYRSYFREVFLNNPWYDESMCSLVYEEGSGNITGFLGVMPRPMWTRGRPVRAAVSSQFIVDPESRFKLAGVQLLKAFLSGPQDLSLADEANNASRTIWERLGGSTALLYSMHWTCPLRPAQFVRVRMGQRKALAVLGFLAAPFCRPIDFVVARTAYSHFDRPVPSWREEDPEVETLLEYSNAFRPTQSLQPEYDRCSLQWLLDRVAQRNGGGRFHKVALRNAAGEVIGWFLYFLDRHGICEVLQIGSEKGSARRVLDSLFHHAWRNGAVAVMGRLESGLMPELWARRGLFHHRRYWMLVHARKPELLQDIHRGEAFLTRLEGEWCMRFQNASDQELANDAALPEQPLPYERRRLTRVFSRKRDSIPVPRNV